MLWIILTISSTFHPASGEQDKPKKQDGVIAFVKNHPIKSLLCIYSIAQTSKFIRTVGQSRYYLSADLKTILVSSQLNLGEILAKLCHKYFPSMVRNDFTIGLCGKLNGIF